MNIKVLYEDNMLIAVEKPSGILSQGDYSGKNTIIDAVKDYIKIKYDKPGNVFLGVIHRLDKSVSGIILFPKNSKSASRLSEQVRNRKFIKFYLAVTPDFQENTNEWTRINNHIRREKNISLCSNEKTSGSQESVLHFKKISGTGKFALVLISLETGRKHQIRATMSSMKIPVVGDTLYGSGLHFRKNAIALHSCYVKFMHPTQKEHIEIFSLRPDFDSFFDMTIFEETIKSEIFSFCLKGEKQK